MLALTWLRQSVAGFSPRRCDFSSRPVNVGFVVDKVAVGMVFLPVLQISPFSVIPQMLYTYSSIYHRRCVMFFSQHFSFSCQYHSTNAPYSFIQLPPTLYNVFLPALQFPLLVSFHQCPILIHSSTTDAV